MGAILLPLLIYWLVLFVACFTVVEVAQDQFYDEVTPRAGLKVASGSLILAAFATWLHPTYDTMYTADIAKTALQAIVWFGVFTLILQFHPTHAASLGILTLLIVPGLASMGVESITAPRLAAPATRYVTPTKPVRSQVGGITAPPVSKAVDPSKAATKTATPAKK
ncbi:hypothetical protein [Singulisphaera sp. PoT]|uniref:hypothetical protein n=1 Tax=Singulisphaera sp. PoT TaxID=3411797 RepID=UPI003BF53D8F